MPKQKQHQFSKEPGNAKSGSDAHQKWNNFTWQISLLEVHHQQNISTNKLGSTVVGLCIRYEISTVRTPLHRGTSAQEESQVSSMQFSVKVSCLCQSIWQTGEKGSGTGLKAGHYLSQRPGRQYATTEQQRLGSAGLHPRMVRVVWQDVTAGENLGS